MVKADRIAALVAIGIVAGWAASLAHDGPDGHEHESGAASRPAQVAATVGDSKIPTAQVEGIRQSQLAKMPPSQRQKLSAKDLASARESILHQIIQGALLQAHLKTLPCSEKELAERKENMARELKAANLTVEQFMTMRGLTDEDLRGAIKFRRLQSQAASKEKVASFLKESPTSYFDGTTVRASHILIACKAYSSAADKAKARGELEKVAAAVRSGKLKFADAAKAHSACPSGARGGDLGAFTFDKMVLPFSVAAFGMKVGEVSGIVETPFGYHLIKVTERSGGSGKPGPMAEAVARNVLLSKLHAEMIRTSAQKNPVVVK